MATPNLTVTIVPFKLAPIMIENSWQFICLNTNVNAYRSRGDGSVMLSKPGYIITRDSDGMEVGLIRKRGDEDGDDIAPLFKSATILGDGMSVRVVFDEAVVVGPANARGMRLNTPTDIVKLVFSSISESNPKQVIFVAARVIHLSEIGCTVSYNQPIGGFQDAAGNDVASFANQPVTNNSIQ